MILQASHDKHMWHTERYVITQIQHVMFVCRNYMVDSATIERISKNKFIIFMGMILYQCKKRTEVCMIGKFRIRPKYIFVSYAC